MIENLDETVLHEKQNQRFVLTVDNEQVYTKYRLINDKTIEFYSTYTPPQLRGQGFAASVVITALDYADENKLEVIATCWYVRKILSSRTN